MILQQMVKGNSSNFLRNHIVVIILFIAFTGLFTYPSYLKFDELIGGFPGDSTSWFNPFWWYQYNIKNPSEPFDFHWLFYNDYQFYPVGTPINEYGLLSAWSTIVLMPLFGDDIAKVYNLLVYLSFIFTGYGTFQLIHYLTKNYYASLIGGLIFTFGFYHMFHVNGHLSYLMTQFVPLAVLFMLKSKDSTKMKNPIIGGIFLFLTLSFSLYIGFFALLFLAAFLIYLLISKVSFRTFLRFFLLVLIGLSLAFPIYYGHYAVTGEPQKNHYSEFVSYGVDISNYFVPAQKHIFYQFLGHPFGTAQGSIETWHFLGFLPLFLTIIALLRIDREKKSLWIISGILLGVISLGPVLKVYGYNTGILLPYYFLWEAPYFEIWRAVGRAGLFVTFSVSILAAYGINEIYKLNSISKYKKHVIVGIIGTFIIIEMLVPPLQTWDLELYIPDIYYEIAKDPEFSAVLEAPIGRYTLFDMQHLETNHITNLYQTVHEKPVYSGLVPRIPEQNEKFVLTYFLNQFIWNHPREDIVKQDLNEVGISIFNHYNIGYVIARDDLERTNPNTQNLVKTEWYPEIKSLLFDIFSKKPDYEAELKDNFQIPYNMLVYKVPKSTSITPYLTLSQDWTPFLSFYRTIGQSGVIEIGNPSKESQTINLEIIFATPTQNQITFELNKEKILVGDVEQLKTYQASMDLILQPGINELKIILQDTTTSKVSVLPYMSKRSSLEKEVGIAVNEISINYIPSGKTEITSLDDSLFVEKVQNYAKVNQAYLDILKRNPIASEMEHYSKKLVEHPNYSLEDVLKSGSEYNTKFGGV